MIWTTEHVNQTGTIQSQNKKKLKKNCLLIKKLIENRYV